jgi:hypothetical protein
VSLPGTSFEIGGKEVEVFTLEDKGSKAHTFEVLFIEKASQANIGSYQVQSPRFREKGFVFDVQSFFDAAIADFKRINA